MQHTICPHSPMARRSNGNAEIQVQFLLRAPLNFNSLYGCFLFVLIIHPHPQSHPNTCELLYHKEK